MPLDSQVAPPAATRTHPPRLPATAQRLRLPLYERNQARLRERWGFDLNAADASARAEALLSESPSDTDRLLLAASVRSSRGDDGGALAAARAAVAGDDASARAHTTLATLLGRSGDSEQALRHAARAAELDGADPTALYNRGVTAWVAGDRAQARVDFDRAAEMLDVPLPWWSRWRRHR